MSTEPKLPPWSIGPHYKNTIVEQGTGEILQAPNTPVGEARVAYVVKVVSERPALLDALWIETRCEECLGAGSITTEAGYEACGGCEGTGEYCRSVEAEALLARLLPAVPPAGEGRG